MLGRGFPARKARTGIMKTAVCILNTSRAVRGGCPAAQYNEQYIGTGKAWVHGRGEGRAGSQVSGISGYA